MTSTDLDSHRLVVAVGTDFHPFDRLVEWTEHWLASRVDDDVSCLMQYGTSTPPQLAEGVAHLSHGDLQDAMAGASVVICHGGPVTIAEARMHGHRPICVARDDLRGEHVDGHQKRFVRRLAAENVVAAAETEDEFRSVLDEAVFGDGPDPASSAGAPLGVPNAAVSDSVRRVSDLVAALVSSASGRRSSCRPTDDTFQSSAPKVNVVIATRDRPELLRRTIDSVLTQEYEGEIQVIVVFDGYQPDLSLEVEDGHRGVHVIRNVRSQGLAGARNSGILAADAPLVAFCDDDDLWLPGKLQRQVDALLDDEGLTMVCCGIQVRYRDSITTRALAMPEIPLHDLLGSRLMELHPSTFLLRRAAIVDGFGLVAEDIPGGYAEDYELLLRAAKHGRIGNVDLIGAEILWHQQSYFTARWETIVSALTWLLQRYPEFQAVPAGHARLQGQIAFALAALGKRREAVRWAGTTLRTSAREPRAYLALLVACRLVAPTRVLGLLHRVGKGI